MTRTIACRLSLGEWEAFERMCQNHHVNHQDMLRSIVIDALLDEGYDALRRRESEGCEDSGETSETSGATTS